MWKKRPILEITGKLVLFLGRPLGGQDAALVEGDPVGAGALQPPAHWVLIDGIVLHGAVLAGGEAGLSDQRNSPADHRFGPGTPAIKISHI